jgi:siroheme synthase (precorrin-2 oxidase/ferrochelatase)
MPVVKKTVALHPIMDRYIRRTWALLIEAGYDATYSTALNFILLGAVLEAIKEGGWSDETRRMLWDSFMEDRKTIEELNLEDMLTTLSERISKK